MSFLPAATAALTSTNTIRPDGKVVVKFTAGSGTWTVPAWVSDVEVLVVGGGGSGASGGNYTSGGGGGGGGFYNTNSYSVTPGSSLTVEVGAGGAAQLTTGQPGSPGGNSIFDDDLVAYGGEAGPHGDGSIASAASGGFSIDGGSTTNGIIAGAVGAGCHGGSGAGVQGLIGWSGGAATGGAGLQSDIEDGSTLVYYGGGGGGSYNCNGGDGGGGRGSNSATAEAGVDGLGGGSGGGGQGNDSGVGGAGVVCVAHQPYPITNSPATDISDISGRLNAVLKSSVTNYTVYVHWNTSNGGTNIADWTNSASVGAWTNVSSTNISSIVTGLDAETLYYFTFRATNENQHFWATNVTSFTTMATPVEPVVDNDGGPTNTTANGATLRGELSAGIYSWAWICWGTNDAGKDATGDWDNVDYVGYVDQDVVFSNAVTGLSASRTYWYRCFVTNTVGIDWSATATSFSALPVSAGDYSMEITFTNFVDRGTLTNFPALVKLTTNNTDTYTGFLGANGYELRFWTNSTLSGTELNYEIEKFDNTTNSYIWVQVPYLTNNCSIWATWGDTANTNQETYTTNGATWSEGYVGVYHLNDTPGNTATYADATTVNNGTMVDADNDCTRINGIIGEAVNLADGEPDYIELANESNFDQVSDISVSFWIKDYPAGSWDAWVAKGENQSWQLRKNDNNDKPTFTCRGTSVGDGIGNTFTLPDGNWHYIVGTLGDLQHIIYVDSTINKSSASAVDTMTLNDLKVRIGGRPDGGANDFSGPMDEVRISDVVRSSNWVWACWMNQSTNHDSFVEYGTPIAGAAIVNEAPSSVTNNAAVFNSAFTSGATNYDVYVHWGTTDKTTNFTWDSSALVGSWTNVVSQSVSYTNTSLQGNGIYYYTFRATNSTENIWATPSWQFMTLESLTGTIFRFW